jgi:uncharacterized protein YbbK (DUF523 family)
VSDGIPAGESKSDSGSPERIRTGGAKSPSHSPERIQVGVSACLLGRDVRYDGGNKQCAPVTGELSDLFDWVPVCPEVEIGLGVPREPIRLEGRSGPPRLVATRSRRDVTPEMTRFATKMAKDLRDLKVAGFIFKKASPSCGLAGVPVHAPLGPDKAGETGRGLFARLVVDSLPDLPVVEEDGLLEPDSRRQFVEAVTSYHRRSFSRSDGA